MSQREEKRLKPVIEVAALQKSFGRNHVLRGVDFDVMPGEIHALLGANGAGKSTLIKIASGHLSRDSGSVSVDGGKTDDPSVLKEKVAVVYQELALFPHLSAAENICLPKFARGWFPYRRAATYESAYRALSLIDADFAGRAVDTLVGQMSLHEQQMVEIAKVLNSGARLLLLDEPTGNLTAQESDQLFRVVRDLVDRQQIGVVFVSHRMHEIRKLADRCTVLRDGCAVVRGELLTDLDDQKIVETMEGNKGLHEADAFGRSTSAVEGSSPETEQTSTEHAGHGALLDVRHPAISIELHAGRILGLAGAPKGPCELIATLIGDIRKTSWEAQFKDGRTIGSSPRQTLKNGVGFVSGDRGNKGLFPALPIKDNLIAALRVSKKRAFVRPDEKRITEDAVSRLSLDVDSIWSRPGSLSGGNQQKILLARWLELQPRLFVLEDPTRGVDITTKRELYKLIKYMASRGSCVVCWSTEHHELTELCDDILAFDVYGDPTTVLRNELLTEDAIASATGMAA